MKVLKKTWAKLVLCIMLLALIGAGSTLYVQHRHKVAEQQAQAQQSLDAAKKLKTDSSNDGKAAYYTNLGNNYINLNDHTNALKNYLEADKYIVNRAVNGGNSVNVLIAEQYGYLGNKQKAREYYDRELKRLAGTNNASVSDAIKAEEAKL